MTLLVQIESQNLLTLLFKTYLKPLVQKYRQSPWYIICWGAAELWFSVQKHTVLLEFMENSQRYSDLGPMVLLSLVVYWCPVSHRVLMQS